MERPFTLSEEHLLSSLPQFDGRGTLSWLWAAVGCDGYKTALNKHGEATFQLANPDIHLPTRVSADWPFTPFSDVTLISVAYVMLVIFSKLLLGRCWGEVTARDGVLDAGPLASRGKRRAARVSAKFTREPVLVLQMVYNAAQVVFSCYMIRAAYKEYKAEGYSPICNRFEPSRTGMAVVLWLFFFSKIIDFLDTAFIIIRGKWKQLTFLHVYHHVTIFLFNWLNINVAYDGDIYFIIMLNSSVHAVMYFYYLLRTIEFDIPTVIKKSVTNLQMMQFIMMAIQGTLILVWRCPFPPRVTAAYVVYILSLFILFHNFSRQEYGQAKKAWKTQ